MAPPFVTYTPQIQADGAAPGTAQLLDLADIQGAVLLPRPSPCLTTYILLRIDDAADGRELARRLVPLVATAENWWDPPHKAWLSVAFSHAGLRAMGLPQQSLDSFPAVFRQGMAARAGKLGDVGPSAPEHWDSPLGSADVHVALSLCAGDDATMRTVMVAARETVADLAGISVVYRLDAPQLPTRQTHLGFVDGIGEPNIEGSGVTNALTGRNHYGYLPGFGEPVKAGEFLLGYENQLGYVTPRPEPETLRRNGTYVAFRKLHIRVAEFRRYLRDNSSTGEEAELLAAKMIGRWRSGAPLMLAPEHDDPGIAADVNRVNDFAYHAEDPHGLRCPLGAHIRRMNPRDSLTGQAVDPSIHRALRRGATYGPPLPDGVMEDDGIDRGVVFIFIGADLDRQFEFLKSQWLNDGDFIGLGTEKDPVVGANDGTGVFTIPQRPIRRRLQNVPQFMITTGGEYLFMPGIRALKWLADLPEGQP